TGRDSCWWAPRKAIGRFRPRPPLSRQRPGRKRPSGGHRVNGAEVGSQNPGPAPVPRQNSEYEEINRLLGWLSIKSAVCSVFQSPSSHPSFRSSNDVVIWLSRILLSDNNWQSSNVAIPCGYRKFHPKASGRNFTRSMSSTSTRLSSIRTIALFIL